MTANKHRKDRVRALADKLGVPYMTALRMDHEQHPNPVSRSDHSGESPHPGHAFISYVREDSAQVAKLQQILEAAGILVWRDTDSLWPGEDWQAKIETAISNDALAFIACFSHNTALRQKSYMNEELALAIAQLRLRQPGEPWLIPVRFDDCDIPNRRIDATRALASFHGASLFGENYDREAQRLVTVVRRLLQQTATSAPAEPPVEAPRPQSATRPRPPAAKPVVSAGLAAPMATRSADPARLRNADSTYVQNSDFQWNLFSSDDYWLHNYSNLQPEDRQIIQQVSEFFIDKLGKRPYGQQRMRGIDIGSGTNLYPALLMLPWVDQILLTDFSARNINWLCKNVMEDSDAWAWGPFWDQLRGREYYNQIGDPHKRLREACHARSGHAGIEQQSVFNLPSRQWDIGTMFFVAESITESPQEFRAALEGFLSALKVGSPFATAFMADSNGYSVAGRNFPALPITPDVVAHHLTQLGAHALTVEAVMTQHRVRDGYAGMIVATGFVGKP